MKKVVVLPYDVEWKRAFEQIEAELLRVLNDVAVAIEHIGSTSVEGLAAKPVIDIDVVIRDYDSFEMAKEKLAQIGYEHEGDLGIKDRQAFKYAEKPHLLKHHLYVCPAYSEELKRHVAFRDYLRTHTADRDWYGNVKMLAAERYPEDINSYTMAKSPCVVEIIRKCTM